MTEEQEVQAAPEATHLVEGERALSQSLLWSLQRRYFEQAGIEAWSEGAVPMYVTSNPFIARAYARLVDGFLRDRTHSTGSGRFAYGFLHKLAAEWQQAEANGPHVTYVMTEYNPDLLSFWQRHPALRPFVEAGQLDFALFDAAHPGDLHLDRSGRTLARGEMANPVVVIANYFFDSIPQDVFYVKDGQLFESRVALYSTQPEPNREDPYILDRLKLAYHRRRIGTEHYQDPALDALLDVYRREFDNTALAFPSIGLRCMRFFAELSGGHMLLLSSDKGYHQSDELAGRSEPGIEVHGSFSMGVNYHAIANYFRGLGGLALCPSHRYTYLATCAFAMGQAPQGHAELTRTYRSTVDEFGPEDFFLLQSQVEKNVETLSVEAMLSVIRVSGYDPRIFQKCFPNLLNKLPSGSALMKAEALHAIDRLWESHFYIGEEYDLPYDLGVLLYKLGQYEKALEYFRRSLELHGVGPKTLYNMGLCHYLRQEFGAALRSMAEAQKLDPTFEPATNMHRKLLAELAGHGS
jgi:hypothetical protein